MTLSSDLLQIQIIRLKNEAGTGLGFGIVGGASTGVVVKTILPGSASDKDKRLQPGDRIFRVGQINTQGMNSQQVAALLRQTDPEIELVVGRQINMNEELEETPFCWTMSTRSAVCPSKLDEQIQHRLSQQSRIDLLHNASDSMNVEQLVDIEDKSLIKEDNMQQLENQDPSNNCVPLIKKSTSNEVVKKHQASTQSSTESFSTIFKDITKNSSSGSNSKASFTSKRSIISKSQATSTDRPLSLKNLQEMALTTFTRENWIPDKYQEVGVELIRDPQLGLGITVAEEISGVFVKSLIPNSNAHLCNKIRVHDLIIEVNDKKLEGLTHAESIKTLMKSGNRVLLKMIRFDPNSPQSICLKLLHEQEINTELMDMHSTLLDYNTYWKNKLGKEFEVINVILKPDNIEEDAGLGISLEGTVDIVEGNQLFIHHYVESLRKDSPAAKSGILKTGDELLQVNQYILYGKSYITVRQALSKASSNLEIDVILILCRKSQHINLYIPNQKQSLPLAYPLLAGAYNNNDRIFKAKSITSLYSYKNDRLLQKTSRKLKSSSLGNLSGLSIWDCIPTVIILEKDSNGLGFSVIDYQDPLSPSESVIIIRSLVPGGVAQADGRILPGDRLLFINEKDMSNTTLENAVEILKSLPIGLIKIGIAKPIPIPSEKLLRQYSPLISRSEQLLAKRSSPRMFKRKYFVASSHQEQILSSSPSQEEVWNTELYNRRLNSQLYFPSSGSVSPATPNSRGSMFSWSQCSSRSTSPINSPSLVHRSWASDIVYLPPQLERTIKIMKGPLSLGIILDSSVDKGINGCVVKSICSKKAIYFDGRIQVGFYIVKINTENLRNITNSQAKAILKRTNLAGVQCSITYITASDAIIWKQKYHQYEVPVCDITSHLSPKVFPKFYKSPYLPRKQIPENSHIDNINLDELYNDVDKSNLESKCITNILNEEEIHLNEFTSSEEINPESQMKVTNEDTSLYYKLAHVESFKESPKVLRKERENKAFLIDGVHIDIYVHDLVQKALVAAIQELEYYGFEKYGSKNSIKMKSPKKKNNRIRRGAEYVNDAATQLQSSFEDNGKRVKIESILKDEDNSLKEKRRKLSNPEDLIGHQIVSTDTIESSETTTSIGSILSEPMDQLVYTSESSIKKKLARINFWTDPREVILSRNPGETFGISIVGGRVEVTHKSGQSGSENTVTGIFIKSVMPNSPAGRSGKIFMGDRVLSVNDVDLRNASHDFAVLTFKEATNPVKFMIQSLTNQTEASSLNSARQNVELIYQPMEKKDKTISAPTSLSSTSTMEIDKIHNMGSKVQIPQENITELTDYEHTSNEKVITTSESNSVKSIIRKSSKSNLDAESEPMTKVVSTQEITITNVSPIVSLPKEEMKILPSTSSVDSLKRKLIRNASRKKPELESAASLEKLAQDTEQEDRFYYTTNKIKRKYGSLPGEPMLFRLENIPSKGGLGLSLGGNGGKNDKVFIVDIKSTSPLPLIPGDELLEINGKILFGLSNECAALKIREVCENTDELALVILRKKLNEDSDIKNGKEIQTTEQIEENKNKDEINISNILDTSKVGQSKIMESKNAASSSPNISSSISAIPSSTLTKNASSSLKPTSEGTLRKKSYSMERTANIETGKETFIEIDKDGKGLGLSIVGGSDTVLGTVVIHEVYTDGAAAIDGRLRPGDQIFEVNGTSLRGVTHEQAISLLRRTPAKVRLLVYRDVNLQLSLLDPTQIYNIFEIELIKKPGRGLGISIVGRKNEPGVYVSEIVKGGVAEADGRLLQGDQILSVNSADVTNSIQEDVATMLKTITGKVTLKVGRWKLTETANRVHAAQPSSIISNDVSPQIIRKNNAVDNDMQHPSTSNHTNNSTISPLSEDNKDVPPPAPLRQGIGEVPHVTVHDENQAVVHSDLSPVTEEPSSQNDLKSLAETTTTEESYTISKIKAPPLSPSPQLSISTPLKIKEIQLNKDLHEEGSEDVLVELKKTEGQQWGMGIGKRARGILITSLQPGSTAAEKLKVGDKICAVNEEKIVDQHSAVTLVKSSGNYVIMQIARPIKGHGL